MAVEVRVPGEGTPTNEAAARDHSAPTLRDGVCIAEGQGGVLALLLAGEVPTGLSVAPPAAPRRL